MDKSKTPLRTKAKARNDVLEDWYFRYRNDLLRYWMSAMPHSKAEELVQEIFARLLKVDDTCLIRSPRAYLFKIGNNVLSEWHVRSRRFPMVDAESDAIINNIPTGANPPEDQHQLEQLQRALAALPPTLRAAVVLHTKHGLTYDQIAQYLKVSKRMVRRYTLKGYAELRLLLNDNRNGC